MFTIETEAVPLEFSVETGPAEGTMAVLTRVRDVRVAQCVMPERIEPLLMGIEDLGPQPLALSGGLDSEGNLVCVLAVVADLGWCARQMGVSPEDFAALGGASSEPDEPWRDPDAETWEGSSREVPSEVAIPLGRVLRYADARRLGDSPDEVVLEARDLLANIFRGSGRTSDERAVETLIRESGGIIGEAPDP